jgi:transposase-like protein
MAKVGRPTKFDPETGQKILRLLTIGATFHEAARTVGVHYETILNWRKRGEAQKRGKFRDFFEGVERAMEAAKVNSMVAIEAAIRGHKSVRTRKDPKTGDIIEEEEFWLLPPQWTAAAWRLERLDPQRWGRQVPLVQQNIQQNTVTAQVAEGARKMSREEILARLKELGTRHLITEHSEQGRDDDDEGRDGTDRQ